MLSEFQNVLWVMKSGAFKATSYNLFLTREKVILAKICTHKSPVASAFTLKSTKKAVAIGGAIGGVAVRNRQKTLEKAVEVAKMPIDKVVEVDKDNFEITKSEIKKVKLLRKGLLKNIVMLEIETKDKKYKWQVMGIPGQEECRFEDVEAIIRSSFNNVEVRT